MSAVDVRDAWYPFVQVHMVWSLLPPGLCRNTMTAGAVENFLLQEVIECSE